MQLVLAVHPDQRQTEPIAALLRKRLGVDMVQAGSAGEGLQELGDRIPDLILTAPLLSPFDEDVLAEYLRELGSAAAHVQTLRIPVLSTPGDSSSGIFSFGRKKRVESAPDGCDPKIFVEEITEYLARAAEERRAAEAAATHTIPKAAPAESRTPLPTMDADAAAPAPDDAYSYQFDPSPYPETSAAPAYIPVSDSDETRFDTAFPIYRPGQDATRPVAEPETVPSYQADEVSSPSNESAFPIYRSEIEPLPAAPSAAASSPDDSSAESAFPIYRREHSILEPGTYGFDSTPPATSVTPIYQPPPERIEPITQSDPLGMHVDEQFDTHASLVLDPPSTPVREEPFVVHPANETIPLSESLERAAAQLEASGIGEPIAPRERERVPIHGLSALDELPLPEELSARVVRSAQIGLSAPLPPSVDVDPSLLAPEVPKTPKRPLEERAQPISVGSVPAPDLVAPAPVVIQPPVPPVAAQPAPTAAPIELAPRTPEPARTEAIAETKSVESPIAKPAGDSVKTAAAPRRSPSFEAALAAIRKAWGKQRAASSSSDSPLSLNIGHVTHHEPAAPPPAVPAIAEPVPAIQQPAPAVGAAPTAPLPTPATTTDEEEKPPREVDLTLDIDALEAPAGPMMIEPEQIDVVSRQVDEDVYELSASPALHDLEADLDAAGPPPPVREVFPETPRAAEPPARGTIENAPPPAGRKRDKHRKKSDKQRSVKGQKAAPKPANQNKEPAQDEWGLFDPNRCGFAAVVDKLNEVTGEKEEKPAKTSVRVISYG